MQAKLNKVRVFFSYSHQDEKYRDDLEKHLTMLKRSNLIETWHDRKISAGDKWDDDIKNNLSSCHIAILLLSKDFLSSDYIWNQELALLRERQSDKEDLLTIIPVFLHPCDVSDLDMLSYQGLPNDMKWIVSSNWTHPDEAYVQVAKGIRETVNKISTLI